MPIQIFDKYGKLKITDTIIPPIVVPSSTVNNYINTGVGASFVDDEIPIGDIDGINVIFTLANTPVTNSLKLFLNGQKLLNIDDFTYTGDTITMINIPHTGDSFTADYRY